MGAVREPFTKLYVHLVWATWDREPLLVGEVEAVVYAGVRSKCCDLGCTLVALGGMPDHIHLLLRFPSSISIAEAVKGIKGASSHVATHGSLGASFKWQGGYGAFTVAASGVAACEAYINAQSERHRSGTTDADWEM